MTHGCVLETHKWLSFLALYRGRCAELELTQHAAGCLMSSRLHTPRLARGTLAFAVTNLQADSRLQGDGRSVSSTAAPSESQPQDTSYWLQAYDEEV